MVNRMIFISMTIGIGWSLYTYLNPIKDSNISVIQVKIKPEETKVLMKTILQKEVKEETVEITLEMLLAQNRFYDALAFYLDSSEKKSEAYQKQIETYLATLAKTDANKALEFMQIFLDNAPESNIEKLIIDTYLTEENFSKAIEHIIQLKENYTSEDEEKRLNSQLKNTVQQYMERLLKHEAYAELIIFLEDMIAYDNTDSFYTFNLAKLYMRLDKLSEATLLLDELQYDEVYAQNVKTLLKTIDKEEEDSDAYQYAIPLQRYGDHFSVNVFLDDTAFNLMLDTGATFIFIDEDKASMLKVIRSNLLLKTAGNEISAKLCEASQMSMGNLMLSNIRVTIAPFKRQGIDGLLGMNFFKQFKFFIDQDEGILYLDPKKATK